MSSYVFYNGKPETTGIWHGYCYVTVSDKMDIGSFMEAITKKLTLKRIADLPGITLMPHTAVIAIKPQGVQVEQDGETKLLALFQTVILASGMRSAASPDESIRQRVAKVEIIGDAANVQDIFSAVKAGYELACKY